MKRNYLIQIFIGFVLLILISGCSVFNGEKKSNDNEISTAINTVPETTIITVEEETTSPTNEDVTEITTQSLEETTEISNNIGLNDHINIAAVGDSLTEGLGIDKDDSYPSQLERKLNDMGYDVSVSNFGISNEKSSATLSRINEVIKEKPDIVILTIGANDAREFIDPKETKGNIKEMVEELKVNDITVVLGGLQIMGDVNLSEAANFIVKRFGVSKELAEQILSAMNYVDSFKVIYPEISSEENVTLIPFFLEGVAGVKELNIADGLHPNKDGYAIIVEKNVLPVLLPILDNQ